MEEAKSHQTPEIKIEPPSPVIESIHNIKSKHENQAKDLSEESNVTQKKVYPKESEVVQTQESSQQSQQNFDGLDREEMKKQEADILTEKEQTSLYEKFPLQEEKQIKHKLKRRVSKKSSKVKPQKNGDKMDANEIDDKTHGKEKRNVNLGVEETQESNAIEETKVEELSTRQGESKTQTREEKENTDISGNKSLETVAENKCQEASIGQPNVASDPAFTSDGVKARMHGDKQHKSPPEKDSDKSQIHIENDKNDKANLNDGDDIVKEILGSCSHVNKILSRIMDDKLEADEEQHDSHNSMVDVLCNKDEIVPKSFEEKPVDLVESIADLTVDKVKEYLLIEEQANKILMKELEETKKKKEQLERKKNVEPKAPAQQNYQNKLTQDTSAPLKHTSIVNSNRASDVLLKQKPKVEETKRTHFKSKKEEQMSRIKDFLKDPNSPTTKDIQLDVRLKKTDSEKEESSKEITKIFDHLYIASYAAVKENQTGVEEISSAIEISNRPNLKSFQDVLHIVYSDENVMLKTIFEKIADKVENTKKMGGKILITCEQSTGVSAAMCIPYLIKYGKLNTREAVKMLEKKRKQAKPNPGIIIRLEEWEAKQSQLGVTGGFSALLVSWFPMLFIIILGYLLFRKIFDVVEKDHTIEKRSDADFYTKLYEYFDVRKWP